MKALQGSRTALIVSAGAFIDAIGIAGPRDCKIVDLPVS